MLNIRAIGAAAACIAAVSTPGAYAQGVSLSQEQNRNVERLKEAGLKDDRAFAILESLTTEVGPRLAGSPAEARARSTT